MKSLDNAIWHALNSHQRHLAVWSDIAVCYQPHVASFAAIPENNAAGLRDLRNLVAIDKRIAICGDLRSENIPGWKLLHVYRLLQLVCKELKPTDHVNAVTLTEADVPEMLQLVALAQPGPFLPRTIEMGLYLGVRDGDRLVAMAGQRFHLTGFCEISAVCTHPDYRGRGYGGGLTSMIAEAIFDNDEIPFLHLDFNNDKAMRLYTKLGFQKLDILPTLKHAVGEVL